MMGSLFPQLKQPLLRSAKLPRWSLGIIALFVLGVVGLVFAAQRPLNTGTMQDRAASQGGVISSTVMEPSPDYLLMTLDVLLKLGLVVGAIYLTLYILRRLQKKAPGNSARKLSVVESLHLSPKQTIHLVRAGSQVLLIGATEQSLCHLGDIVLPAEEELEEQSEYASQRVLSQEKVPDVFLHTLQRAISSLQAVVLPLHENDHD